MFSKLKYFLLIFLNYTPCLSQETGYWKEIYICEDSIERNSMFSVKMYYDIFQKYGIKQMDNWWNAVNLSEKINPKYTDSLLILLSKELDLSIITNPKSESYFKLYLPSLEKKILKYNNPEQSLDKRKLDKIIFKKWAILYRKDQFPRRFGGLISLKQLKKIDEKNRQLFYLLYKENNCNLPNRIDFGRLNYMEPYWILFQHFNLNYKDINKNNNEINMDNILNWELFKGNLSPKYTQYHIVYQIYRAVDKGNEPLFKKTEDFSKYWFLYKQKNTLENLLEDITIEQLKFINDVRERFFMEKIDEDFFNKKKFVEISGFIFR